MTLFSFVLNFQIFWIKIIVISKRVLCLNSWANLYLKKKFLYGLFHFLNIFLPLQDGIEEKQQCKITFYDVYYKIDFVEKQMNIYNAIWDGNQLEWRGF